MRRRAPRPLADALRGVARETTPATLLARVQAAWKDAVGAAVADEATPLSERAGTLTVVCRSAVWANELELLAPEILERLNRSLGGSPTSPLTALRAKVGKAP
jgi:predicted nucleic acid-binding Zn ribbon protein